MHFCFSIYRISSQRDKKNKSRQHERRKTLNMFKNSNEKVESRKASYVTTLTSSCPFFDHLPPYDEIFCHKKQL